MFANVNNFAQYRLRTHNKHKNFFDTHIRFQRNGKSNELLYHPTAGRVTNYGWKDMDGRNPLNGNEHWLQSCEERNHSF